MMRSTLKQNRRAAARWIATTLFWAMPAAGLAQQEAPPIATDRPGQADTTSIALRGSWQVEFGAYYGEDGDGAVEQESAAAPVGVLRIGLTERSELRLGWGGYQSARVEGPGGVRESDGVADASLGAKLLLAEERGRRPRVAVLVATSLPVGDDETGSGRFDPGFRLAFDHALSDGVSWNYNVGGAWQTGDDASGDTDRLATWFYASSLWFGLSERWGSYVEVFGYSPPGGDHALAFGTGLTLLSAPTLQFDGSIEVGLSDAAPDWTLGLGVSYRVSG